MFSGRKLHARQDLQAAYETIAGELLSSDIGKKVSRREREDTFQMDNTNLRYGEMGFDAVVAILDKIRDVHGKPGVGHSGDAGIMQEGGVFVDLGSGMGKAVLAAAIAHPFERVVGVECLEGLHQLAIELQKELEAVGPDLLLAEDARLPDVELIRGDLLKASVPDADVVLIHCACFSEKTMARLSMRLSQQLKIGSFVATVSIQLPTSAGFTLVEALVNVLDGKTEAVVFLQQKSRALLISPQGDARCFDNSY